VVTLSDASDCVSVCNAVTCEALIYCRKFLVCRYIVAHLGQVSVSSSSGKGQSHRSKKCVSVFCLRVVGLRLIGNLVCIVTACWHFTFKARADSANIAINNISLKTTLFGLHFCLQKVSVYLQPLLRNPPRKLPNSVKLRSR